ncbi:uncharacterized protein LOC119745141 [Patiria miniata]|uniref:Protein kinase domain-containing protein n=1 Tax=Patiria miniata TaxID=46514 RepID=A0A914BP72_PATMI|nr:uncharacterized protein LOC119745141 [Patiria miniata]
MFRFATKFASAKFRLLSGRRVAPPPPLSQVRHPCLSSNLQSVHMENDPQLSPSASPDGLGGAMDWTGQTMAMKHVPLDLDGRGDSVPSEGQKEAFSNKFIKRLRRGPKVAPLPPQEMNNGQESTHGSREGPSILIGHEETERLIRSRDMDVTPAEQTDKQPPERKAKKLSIRGRIGRILGIFHRQKVVPLNVIPTRGHPTSAPEGSGLPNRKLQDGCQAQDVKTHSEDKHKDGDAFDPHQDCHTNYVEFETSSRLSSTDEVTTETTVLPSSSATLKKEQIDGGDAKIIENEYQGDLGSTTRLCPCEKLQNEEPGCSPGHVSVASGELLGASDNRETSLDQTSLIRCRSSTTTSPCHDKQGNNPDETRARAGVSSSVKGEFSQTVIQGEPVKPAEGGRKLTASSLGKTNIRSFRLTGKNLVIGTSPCVVKDSRKPSQGPSSLISPQVATNKTVPGHRTILDVKPDALADEMRTMSPSAKQRRVQEITVHIKRRVDLQTLRDLTNDTLPYTSNEGKEIEENARRAETLLSQLKTVMAKADKREPTGSSSSHHSQQHLPVKAQSHRSNSNNLSRHCVQNCTSSKTNRVSGATSSSVHQAALLSNPNIATVKNTVPQQRNLTKPSKSKVAPLCPAIRKRTFRKSTAVQKQGSPAKPTSKDLQKLGLPIIDERDLEPVQTRKGTAIKLGSGDYGEVFLMRSRVDGTLMAVKRLTDIPGSNQKDKRTAEMLQELRAMEAVKSCRVFPNFLGVLDLYSFAQEFVGNARTMISLSAFKLLYKSPRGPHLLPLDWVRICIDVTEGLEMLHGAGWTHNDLHISNILVWRDPRKVTATWEAKIIDLGKASPIKNPPPPKILTFMQMMFAFKNCTQMAPEIVEGRSRYNVKSDVYSLGIALQDIGKDNRLLSSFKTIGDRCVVEEPDQRPELKIILKELNQLCNKFISPRRAGKTKGTR